jgi:hypothetical protein
MFIDRVKMQPFSMSKKLPSRPFRPFRPFLTPLRKRPLFPVSAEKWPEWPEWSPLAGSPLAAFDTKMTPIEQIKAVLAVKSASSRAPAITRAREDGKSPPENLRRSVPTAPTDDSKLTPDDLAEARRIAGELVKLHARGIVKSSDDPEARFHAGILKMFGGTVVNGAKTAPATPAKPTAEQLVKIPSSLRGRALNDHAFNHRSFER